MSLLELSISQLNEKLSKKEFSSVELTKAYLDQIEKYDGDLNAFINVTKDLALNQAACADKEIASGDIKKLTGIPIALKDIILTKDIETTCASKILQGFIPPYSATVYEKLRENGAVLLGKLNQDEFAMGSSNESSAYGSCKNPWNKDYIPGGSSGGSAVAVAARQAVATLGTDTGGSIRQPASHCSCVGVKPTYGRVSRYGVIAYASSLDQVGPMAKNVKDAAIMLECISGYDKKDSTSVDLPAPNFLKSITGDVKGLKIGLPKEYYIDGLSPEVSKSIDEAIEVYKSLGAEFVPMSLSFTDYALACYYIIATAEASSNLARYEGVRFGKRANASNLYEMMVNTRSEGFGEEVKRRKFLENFSQGM